MIRYKPNAHLDRLDRIFQVDISKILPAPFTMFIDALTRISILFALIATPYILYVIIINKKLGWLLFFLVFVILYIFQILLDYFQQIKILKIV